MQPLLPDEAPRACLPSSLSPPLTAAHAEASGLDKAGKSPPRVLLLAVTAGVFIALAFVFCLTVWTGADSLPWGLNRLLGGLVFSSGLIMLVICGGELFTSAVLACVPWASGRLGTRQLLRYWGLVYAGNLLGSLLMAVLLVLARVHELDGGQWGATLLLAARHKLEHDFVQALVLGILCNLLVCLAVWMSYATRSAGTRAALVVLPVALFVSAGFEHVVANMFLLPTALLVQHLAGADHWLALGISAADLSHLTLLAVLRDNLLPVTLGNIAGGALVGLVYWALYRRTQGITADAPGPVTVHEVLSPVRLRVNS